RQASSNIGDLAGIFTYSTSAGTICPSHTDWTKARRGVVVMPGAYHDAVPDRRAAPREPEIEPARRRMASGGPRAGRSPALVVRSEARLARAVSRAIPATRGIASP